MSFLSKVIGFLRQTDRVVAEDPAVVSAVVIRARKAIRAQQYLEAAWLLDECPVSVERDCAALNLLGLIAESEENWDRAKKCWSRALAINPSYDPAYQNLARYYELFQFGRTSHPVTYGDEHMKKSKTAGV